MTRKLAHTVAIFLMCVAWLSCTPDYDDEYNSPAVDEEGDADFEEVDTIQGDEGLGGDDTGEESDVTPNEPDVEPYEGWEECDCPNPDEMCSPHRCGLPDISCGPGGEECPEGYACENIVFTSSYVCLCDGDKSDCVPRCEGPEDCPAMNQACSTHEAGKCLLRVTCSNSLDCPSGFICDADERVCVRTGNLELGEACEDGMDCISGTCYHGLCDQQCLSDSDCEDGEHCRRLAGLDDIGCTDTFPCQISCPPDTICRADECSEPFCLTTADCDVGDCVQNPFVAGIQPAECEETGDPNIDRYCKPEERLHYYAPSPPTSCYIPQPCWYDADCEPPYYCPTAYGGYCTRDIDD